MQSLDSLRQDEHQQMQMQQQLSQQLQQQQAQLAQAQRLAQQQAQLQSHQQWLQQQQQYGQYQSSTSQPMPSIPARVEQNSLKALLGSSSTSAHPLGSQPKQVPPVRLYQVIPIHVIPLYLSMFTVVNTD